MSHCPNTIKALRSAVPDLFIAGYARQAQAKFQPFILNVSDVEAWREQTFVGSDGKTHHCQAMPFPPLPAPSQLYRMILVSSAGLLHHTTNPYPIIKTNFASNKDVYAWIPACGKVDMLGDVNSLYYKAAVAVPPPVVETKTRTMLPLPEEVHLDALPTESPLPGMGAMPFIPELTLADIPVQLIELETAQ